MFKVQELTFKFQIGDTVRHKSNPNIKWVVYCLNNSLKMPVYNIRRMEDSGKLQEVDFILEDELAYA